MHSILDSIFGSIFGRFLLPTSTPESQLNASRLAFSWFSASKVNIDFWSHFGTNLVGFWYPKSTKIHPKIDSKRHQIFDRFFFHFGIQNPLNPSKNRFQEASKKWCIFASIFEASWLQLGIQVGAMLATFSSKMGGPCGRPPPFLLGLCYFSIFWLSWPPLGSIWARFWRVWASILDVFGVHFGGFGYF